MKSEFSIMLLISSLLISSPVHVVRADDDYIEAKRLRYEGKIMSLEEILKNVRKTYPGRILEVELEKLQSDIKKARETVRQDLEFSF